MSGLLQCLLNTSIEELDKFDQPYSVVIRTTNSGYIAEKYSELLALGVDPSKIIKLNCVFPELADHGYNPFKGKDGFDIAKTCMALLEHHYDDAKTYIICFVIANALLELKEQITPKLLAHALNNKDYLIDLSNRLNKECEGSTIALEYYKLIASYSAKKGFDFERLKLDLQGIAGILHRLGYSFVGEVFEQADNISILESVKSQKYIFINTAKAPKGSNYYFLNRLIEWDLKAIGNLAKVKKLGVFLYNLDERNEICENII